MSRCVNHGGVTQRGQDVQAHESPAHLVAHDFAEEHTLPD
jgi:hypothetical protein